MPLPSIPDYSTCIKTPALVHPAVLKDGHPIEKGVRLIKYSGGFCVVFPYQTASNKYAVRCWHAEVSDAKRRTRLCPRDEIRVRPCHPGRTQRQHERSIEQLCTYFKCQIIIQRI